MNLVYLPEARLEVLAAVNYYYECDGGKTLWLRIITANYKKLNRTS